MIILFLLGGALLVAALPALDDPLGPSHHGQNAAQWALAGEGVREHGLIESRLGAINPDGQVYARHPPLTGLAQAATQGILGGGERAVRLPGLLSALALIPLLWLFLRRLGVDEVSAAVGAGGTLASPMFFGFGPLVDTPMLALPVALGVLVLWLGEQRRPWLLGLAAALAVLSAWEAALLVGLVIAVDVLRAVRAGRRLPWEMAAGFAVGTAALLGWLIWVHGSLGPVVEALMTRAGVGERPVGLAESLAQQYRFLVVGFSPVVLLLGLVGCGLAIVQGRHRWTLVAILATVGVYPIVLRQAAYFHPYWNYWIIVPLAIGLAYVADAVVGLRSRIPVRPQFLTGALSSSVALLLTLTLARPTYAEWEEAKGLPAGGLLRDAELRPAQRTLWLVGDFEDSVPWARYYARRRVVRVDTITHLRTIRRTRPGDLVLVGATCTRDPVCDHLGALDSARSAPALELLTTDELSTRS